MVTEMGSASIGGISPALSANAAKSFLEATDKEKKEMQGLNDRLGNYIDRVKKLEEQNRKLVADLEELRGRWGKDTSEIKVNLTKYPYKLIYMHWNQLLIWAQSSEETFLHISWESSCVSSKGMKKLVRWPYITSEKDHFISKCFVRVISG